MIYGYTPASSSGYGSYVGDGNLNKAVAHGLGRIPYRVDIRQSGTSYDVAVNIVKGLAQVNCNGAFSTAVTAMDATNFYVGADANHGNNNGTTYYWVAV